MFKWSAASFGMALLLFFINYFTFPLSGLLGRSSFLIFALAFVLLGMEILVTASWQHFAPNSRFFSNPCQKFYFVVACFSFVFCLIGFLIFVFAWTGVIPEANVSVFVIGIGLIMLSLAYHGSLILGVWLYRVFLLKK